MRTRLRHYSAGLALALFACTEAAPEPLPGAELRARVAERLDRDRDDLRDSIGHYALIEEPSQEELHRFMAQIYPKREGPDIVMAALGGNELHGGGVLRLIATLWRPDGRRAELDDVFSFPLNRSQVSLREIYESLQMQLFLPDSGLPRVRLGNIDLDAYNALALLLRYEADLDTPWTNRVGQRLSSAALLDRSWDHYVQPRSAAAEFDDHSYLHLVEVLLEDDRRDPNGLKQRLLAVELERNEFGGYESSEALGHYTESLGRLIADPRITWTDEEEHEVRDWLRHLEKTLLPAIDDAPIQHLSHLLHGLDQIQESGSLRD